MIEKLGIGTDITDINKFKKISYDTNKKFYEKIFLPSEIKYCVKYKNSSPHFAGKFAVKESVIKAISEKISFLDIETFHSNSKPQIRLKGKINKKYAFRASISHEKNFAIAVVISEKTDKYQK
jgi:holo-[acyl-carrier protein] synthase